MVRSVLVKECVVSCLNASKAVIFTSLIVVETGETRISKMQNWTFYLMKTYINVKMDWK